MITDSIRTLKKKYKYSELMLRQVSKLKLQDLYQVK